MKYYKCPTCYREKEVKDNIIIVVCANCQKEMKLSTYGFKKEVELKRWK